VTSIAPPTVGAPVQTAGTAPRAAARPRTPFSRCAVIGLGGLFAGVTGPLLSAFVPPLVRGELGDQRTLIGAVMAIDNVLLLFLVPLAGVASDRGASAGRGRMPLVVAGFVMAAAGMAVFPWSPAAGLPGVVAAMVLLYTGINLQRSPFQALVADAVPSRYRSLATGSVTFQMCAGAIVFLMLGRALGMAPAFLVAAAVVIAIAASLAFALREPRPSAGRAADATFGSLAAAARSVLRGTTPGLRAVFVASLLVQLTFQSFSTWYALHGTERFGVRSEDVTIGFIAWAIGGVAGALPAGMLGVRFGRRTTMIAGFVLMAGCLLALDRVDSLAVATPLLALASASWTLPMVNAYPLFVEPIAPERRGVLAALFLLSMALGGAIGDPLNGRIFDAAGSYRPLFLLMAAYTALALVMVLFVPRGAGEAGTGPDDGRLVGDRRAT
jgi:predicted MFS family arabinose efflux permease